MVLIVIALLFNLNGQLKQLVSCITKNQTMFGHM